MESKKLRETLSHIKSLSQKEQALCLFSLIKEITNSSNYEFINSFLLESFISKDIEFLLSLLESPTAPIRKLSLFLICLICQNPLSKTYLMEKCGLSLIVGKFLLTRLKFIQKWSHDETSSLIAMNNVMAQMKGYPNINQKSILFYIPLNIELRKMPRDFRPKILELNLKDFLFLNSSSKLENMLKIIPDPVFNLCGLDLLREDVKTVISFKTKTKSDINLIVDNKKKQRHSYIQGLNNSNKIHNEKFNQSTQSTIHQSSHSKTNFQEIKSLILNGKQKPGKVSRLSALDNKKTKQNYNERVLNAMPLKISTNYKKQSNRSNKTNFNQNLMISSTHSTSGNNYLEAKNNEKLAKKKVRHTVKAPISDKMKLYKNNFLNTMDEEALNKIKRKKKLDSNLLNNSNDEQRKSLLFRRNPKLVGYSKYGYNRESQNLTKNNKKGQIF